MRRSLVVVGAIAAALPLWLSALLALIATRPRLAALVGGSAPNPSRHPSELGLSALDVEYAPGCDAWWISSVDAVGTVVIVHGFELSDDPRATDPGPRLELAQQLVDASFNALVISLGYGSGAHPHTGGELEAEDIAAAVRWSATEADLPAAVVGFSAGGHAAVVAAGRCEVFAVVTDSAFVDFGEVVVAQGAEILGVSPRLLGAVSRFMRATTGHEPVGLESMTIARGVPMLHLHGNADAAIDHANLARIAAVTGGRAVTVDGADHVALLPTDPDRYRREVIGFLNEALAAASVARSE